MSKKIVKTSGIFLAFFLGFLLIWGLVEPYTVHVENEAVSIPHLPEAWEGEKIAVIGDFQVGMWMDNESTIQVVVDRLREINPSVVLLLGDFVYHPIKNREHEIQRIVQLLQPLAKTNIPIFTVLGNHDYAMETTEDQPNRAVSTTLAKSLDKLGINILRNNSIPLSITNEGVRISSGPSPKSIYIAGLGATWPENTNAYKVLQQIPDKKPRIIFMHNPEAFAELTPYSAPIAIAGHTHGSQVRIPYLSQWFFSNISEEEKIHSAGWINEFGAEGNHLYVNPGIGFSNFPIRINCPPEITVLELKSA